MHNRHISGAVLALTVTAAVVFVGCADRNTPLFGDLSPTVVDAIEITRDGRSASLTRSGDIWWVALPAEPGRADDAAVVEFLETLGLAVRGDVVADGHDELEALGFDSDGDGRILIRAAGRTVVDARIGGDAPDGSRVFLRPEGQRDVFVSPNGLRQILERSLDDWRDHRIMSFGLPDVVGVELINRGERMVIVPVDGRWHMTRPVEQDVHKGYVDGLLFSLAELEATGFVSGRTASECGFGEGTAGIRGSVTVRLMEGPAQSVIFGVDSGDAWCAMRPDRSDVYLVPRELVELIFGDENAEPLR